MHKILNQQRAYQQTEETIEERIQDQNWPNIYIQDTGDSEKQQGVFSGPLPIKKGTVVCDYHGLNRNKAEGEVVLRETEGAEGNYVLF